MEQNFTMNEVIHLFLDGEATNTQRSSLFTAMANDSSLQEEFDRALRLKNALASEAQTVRPSALLTAALFEKAGVATIGIGGGAAVGTAVTTALKTGWFAAAAKFLIPAAAALLGGAATYTVMQNNNASDDSKENIRNERVVTTESRPENLASQNSSASGTGIASNARTNAGSVSESSNTTSHNVKNSASNNAVVKVKTVYVSVPVHDTIYRTVENAAAGSDHANAEEQKANDAPGAASATPREENAKVEKKQDIVGIVDTKNSLSSLRQDPSNASNWLVGVRGVSAIAIYPDRELSNGAADIFNNVSVNVQYDISPNHSFGVEGGTEAFPINVVNGDGSVYKKWSLPMLGGYYRFTADQIGFLGNIRPFFQVLGGGSISGPIGKLTTGIIWEPGDRVQLMLGAEGMRQWYTYQSTFYHGDKLSMTTGVAVRF